jgi:hypothetical protein
MQGVPRMMRHGWAPIARVIRGGVVKKTTPRFPLETRRRRESGRRRKRKAKSAKAENGEVEMKSFGDGSF